MKNFVIFSPKKNLLYFGIWNFVTPSLNNFLIYILYIYRLNEMKWDNTSKNKLFSHLVSAVAVLKGYVEFVIYKY